MTTKHDIPYLDRLKEELMRTIATRQEQVADPGEPRRRRSLVAAGAAAAVVAAGVTAAVLMGGDGAPGPIVTSPPTETAQPPGDSLGQCIQGGTAQAIGEREYGLSGIVVDVRVPSDSEPTEVTVEVDRWYRTGDFGDAASVVLRTSTRPGGEGDAVSLVGGEVPLEVGTRILATGDDDFLWDCGGFSRPWSDEGAALFAEAFGG